MAESSPKEKKTLCEKEKLLVMSNFSFSNSVFKRLVLQKCENKGLFGIRIPLHHTILGFKTFCCSVKCKAYCDGSKY